MNNTNGLDLRKLVYNFLTLQFYIVHKIGRELKLNRDVDKSMNLVDLVNTYCVRAKDAGILSELYEKVEQSIERKG